jgi:hypothetical protein
MRTQVVVKDVFSRDVSFITQEFCEFYAGETIKGKQCGDAALTEMCNGDQNKILLVKTLLETNADFIQLRDDLIDEFGIEFFCKTKSRLEHIRDLEALMEVEKDGKTYAAMLKELRELKGWVEKPSDRNAQVIVNNQIGVSQRVTVDRSDPKALQRLYQSVMG